jgi:hypothetical protein
MGDDVQRQAEAATAAATAATAAPEPAAGANHQGGQSVRAAPTIEQQLDDLRFHTLRASRYHDARQRFLDFWRKVLDGLVIVLGAGTVTSMIGDDPNALPTVLVGLATTVIGVVQLVTGLGERAQEHSWLKKRYFEVLADIEETLAKGSPTTADLARISKARSAIWGDQPPTYHVLDCIAYNAAKRSLDNAPEGKLIYIGRWANLTRNLSTWENFCPETNDERAARKAAEKTARKNSKWW